MSLHDYNADVSVNPQNPIPFNNANSVEFSCQPGFCIDFESTIVVNETGELYSYCGSTYFGESFASTNVSCGLEYCGPLCSISDSNEIMSMLYDESGATGVGVDGVMYIGEVSFYEIGVQPVCYTSCLMCLYQQTSSSLVNTSMAFMASQYGAIHFSHDAGSANYYNLTIANCLDQAKKEIYLNASFCKYLRGIGYVISYNFTALHVAPLFQALADEAIIRYAMDNMDYSISVSIHPLPLTSAETVYDQANNSLFAWVLLVMSFPFIAGNAAIFVVTERQSKAKHLQTVAGMKGSAYWLSNYCWDILNYQIPLWATAILMFAFSVHTFTTQDQGVVGGVITTLVLFGPASAGFTYCLSFAFSSPSFCNVFVIIFNFLIGLAGPLVVIIFLDIGRNTATPKPSFVTLAHTVEWVLRFFPAFNLGNGLAKCQYITSYEIWVGKPITVWDPTVLLYDVIMQAVWCVAYIALAMKIDGWSSNPHALRYWNSIVRFTKCHCHKRYGGQAQSADINNTVPDDDDVIAEQDRIIGGEGFNDLIVINRLTKQYENGKLAVDNLSLGVPRGQCFGLLGINGAGKTTTMSMLTSEFPPSSGDATLAGYSVTIEPEKTRRCIGYCPQFDALFANMTGREHVALYASIKGIPREAMKEVVAQKLAEVGLSDYDSDRLSSRYSGGMKRKLSVACATIGQPQVVFLDEPGTGMDPVSRRDLWAVISKMVAGGTTTREEGISVILTTHSMAECEALCSCIGIMAAGRLRCLGSAQHLKTRFGQGYQVEMKIEDVETNHGDFKSVMIEIAQWAGISGDSEESGNVNAFLNLEQTKTSLAQLTRDSSLASKISQEDLTGYALYCSASSPPGATLQEVASFATAELRLVKVEKFFKDNFPSYSFLERQDNNIRYEVKSEGIRISYVFEKIEENKDLLRCTDYGVSQTSLEQVFNMHAAEAEKLKRGRDNH